MRRAPDDGWCASGCLTLIDPDSGRRPAQLLVAVWPAGRDLRGRAAGAGGCCRQGGGAILRRTRRQRGGRLALDWAAQPGNTILTLGDRRLSAALLEIPIRPSALRQGATGAAGPGRPSLVVVGAQRDAGVRPTWSLLDGAVARRSDHRQRGWRWHRRGGPPGGGLARPGSTVAVIGTGADRIYPARNARWPGGSQRPAPSSASFPSAPRRWPNFPAP